MSIDAYEQMPTGVSDITSIALVTLELIYNALLVSEMMGNLATRKNGWIVYSLDLELRTEIF